MKITKTSLYTGKQHTKELDVTEEQIRRWRSGALIQDVMPHLSPDDREFLISGCTPEEFAAAFGGEE